MEQGVWGPKSTLQISCQASLQRGRGGLQGHLRCVSPHLLRRPWVSWGRQGVSSGESSAGRRDTLQAYPDPQWPALSSDLQRLPSRRPLLAYLARSPGPRHQAFQLTIEANFGSHRDRRSEIPELQVSQFNSLEAKPTVSPRFHSTPLHLSFKFPLKFPSPHSILFESQGWKRSNDVPGGPRPVPAPALSQHLRAAGMGRERAPGPGPEVGIYGLGCPACRSSCFISSAPEIKQPEIKLPCPWIEWSQQTLLTLVVALPDLASKNTGRRGGQIYTEIVVVYLSEVQI